MNLNNFGRYSSSSTPRRKRYSVLSAITPTVINIIYNLCQNSLIADWVRSSTQVLLIYFFSFSFFLLFNQTQVFKYALPCRHHNSTKKIIINFFSAQMCFSLKFQKTVSCVYTKRIWQKHYKFHLERKSGLFITLFSEPFALILKILNWICFPNFFIHVYCITLYIMYLSNS